MRRISLSVIVSALALAVAPGAALARSHHHRHHHRKHVRTHVERFGSQQSVQPGTPVTPVATSPAGTVASFTNGKLTITLADGSSVSGAVTNDTEIECQMAGDNDNDDGVMNTDDQGPSGGGDNGDNNGDNGDNGDQSGDGENGNMCSTASLTPGAVVQDARLELSSAGAVWERIELQ